MHYTLYIRNGTLTAIDESAIEYDICETIGEYYETNPYERFLIVGREKDKLSYTRLINDIQEYIDYYKELEIRRLKETIDIVSNKSKVKTKKR